MVSLPLSFACDFRYEPIRCSGMFDVVGGGFLDLKPSFDSKISTHDCILRPFFDSTEPERASSSRRQKREFDQQAARIMPEGGMYPWKVQKVVTAPTANYRNMALPHDPPAGWEWSQNAMTREWTLREKEVHAVPAETAAVAVADTDDADRVLLDDATIPLAHAEPIGVDDPPPKNLRHRHVVTESDTFQGICLRYKISATQLRQANCFSGTNLKLAPKILNIPHVVMARPMSREDKIVMVLRGPTTCGGSQPPNAIQLSRKEAIAYLEMSDWNVETALDEMRADQEFELSQSQQKLG
jgi:hypothetical protein